MFVILRVNMCTVLTTIARTATLFSYRSLVKDRKLYSAPTNERKSIAVIFGLSFATLLTLVVVPVLYQGLAGIRLNKLEKT